MKKICVFILVATALFACSSDDDNTDGYLYDSHILVQGQPFIPTEYTEDNPTWNTVTAFHEENPDTGNEMRSFRLVSRHDDEQFTDEIYVEINYQAIQDNINGTYEFSLDGNDVGYYRISTAYFTFVSGSVTVTYLGGSNYKLSFANVIAIDSFDNATKTVSGYFKGTFLPV